ncbi:MAG TPA: hypothetical protein VKB09_01420, partial [Thermomicrobiales bacterium]|nr:hypothetical protein [Thermomicrobiales bacterium]
VFGDGHLGEGDTEKIAIAAVRAGADEVRQAYKLGAEGKTLAEIKALLLGGGTQYKAELLVPRLDPAAGAQTMPRWAVETFDQLLADGPMLEALALTIRNNVAEIVELANGMSEPGKSGVIQGFAKVVERDPIRALRNIYAFNPDSGINLHNLGVTGVEMPTH